MILVYQLFENCLKSQDYKRNLIMECAILPLVNANVICITYKYLIVFAWDTTILPLSSFHFLSPSTMMTPSSLTTPGDNKFSLISRINPKNFSKPSCIVWRFQDALYPSR